MEWANLVVEILMLLITGTGIVYAIIEYNKNSKINKNNISAEVLKMFSERRMLSIIREFDLAENKGWYVSGRFYREEFKSFNEDVDYLFNSLSYICFMNKAKIIKIEELDSIPYYLNRVVSSDDSLCYLWNIYMFSESINCEPPFLSLIEYLRDNEMIVLDSEKYKMSYHKKFLNF